MKKVFKFLGKLFLGYLGVCALVFIMDWSSNIGTKSGNTYIGGKYAVKPKWNTGIKQSEPTKIGWVEYDKECLARFNYNPYVTKQKETK